MHINYIVFVGLRLIILTSSHVIASNIKQNIFSMEHLGTPEYCLNFKTSYISLKKKKKNFT